jgi:superfamily II DNA helicase RecQ
MTWKLITLPWDEASQSFDTAPLNRDLDGLGVKALAPVVHPHDGAPRLTVLACCEPPPAPRTSDAWRAKLAEGDRGTFDLLADWRREQGRTLDRPVYHVLTNRVMATLATLRPRTTDELLAVPGVGPMTVVRFGESLLTVLDD